MKGKNKFEFNQSTMQEIVQYYLANVLFKETGVIVTAVNVKKDSTDFNVLPTFTVEVDGPEGKEEGSK